MVGCFSLLELGEGEGHCGLEAVEEVDFLLSGENQFDGMAVFLKLKEGLSADAAGGRGLLDSSITGIGSDCHRLDRDTREFGAGGIEC